MAKKTKFVPVVAVLNMKGGVGKTTISGNLFRRLYLEKEKNCVLIDLDPQFNLTQSLFTKTQYEKLKGDGQTIAKVFYSNTKSGLTAISNKHDKIPCPSDIRHKLRSIIGKEDITIDIVPGDFNLVRFSLMDDKKVLDRAKERFSEFVEKCKLENDLVVLDCNPSSSFLTLCAIAVCTHILVPVRLDKYSVIGLEMLWEFVNEILPIHPKPEFVIVINGSRPSPTKAMRETEAELRGHNIFGSKTLGNTIRETGQLSARTDYTGFSGDRKTSVTQRVKKELQKVADELSDKIGLKK